MARDLSYVTSTQLLLRTQSSCGDRRCQGLREKLGGSLHFASETFSQKLLYLIQTVRGKDTLVFHCVLSQDDDTQLEPVLFSALLKYKYLQASTCAVGNDRESLLQNNNIKTVEDFLKLYYNDKPALRKSPEGDQSKKKNLTLRGESETCPYARYAKEKGERIAAAQRRRIAATLPPVSADRHMYPPVPASPSC